MSILLQWLGSSFLEMGCWQAVFLRIFYIVDADWFFAVAKPWPGTVCSEGGEHSPIWRLHIASHAMAGRGPR